jgi:hypothetical protein
MASESHSTDAGPSSSSDAYYAAMMASDSHSNDGGPSSSSDVHGSTTMASDSHSTDGGPSSSSDAPSDQRFQLVGWELDAMYNSVPGLIFHEEGQPLSPSRMPRHQREVFMWLGFQKDWDMNQRSMAILVKLLAVIAVVSHSHPLKWGNETRHAWGHTKGQRAIFWRRTAAKLARHGEGLGPRLPSTGKRVCLSGHGGSSRPDCEGKQHRGTHKPSKRLRKTCLGGQRTVNTVGCLQRSWGR